VPRARRSGARGDQRRRRAERRLPGASPHDPDLSRAQSRAPHRLSGDGKREGTDGGAPLARRPLDPRGTDSPGRRRADPRRPRGRLAPGVAAHGPDGSRDPNHEDQRMSTMTAAPKQTEVELDQLSINTIRTLSIDAVERAKSGHPGTPMALAPLVYTIWNRVMRFDPVDPIWPNRHASMLLWSVLHLSGTCAVNADYERLGDVSVSLEDIRRFRQLDSKAPGHPEYHWVSGVETTTGPLGQGAATSVGMAIARKWLPGRANPAGFPPL